METPWAAYIPLLKGLLPMTSEIDHMKKFGGKQFLEDKTYRSSCSFDSQRELSTLQNHVNTDRFVMIFVHVLVLFLARFPCQTQLNASFKTMSESVKSEPSSGLKPVVILCHFYKLSRERILLCFGFQNQAPQHPTILTD